MDIKIFGESNNLNYKIGKNYKILELKIVYRDCLMKCFMF